MSDEDTQNIHAEDNSIAVGGIRIGGDVAGNITIGHGYTAEQVSTLITQISATFQPKPFDGRCPYKGLDAFEEQDADLFFGRETLVTELIGQVQDSRTVFITGPSGSGKSSLVRAGLIPALRNGGLPESDRWLYATMKPGRDPFEALALAFSRLKSPELGRYFRDHAGQPSTLNECAESVLGERKDQRLVIFLDQFEEVFTQIHKEEERVAFLNLLTHAATVEGGRVILLFSMRSDFVPNCAAYPDLNATLNRQFIQIGAMQPDELVSAIAQPALRVGLKIDPDLIAQIINDMKGGPGALPLMQFALKDLFDKGQNKGGMIALTLEAYLQHGGIQKSLERHADSAFGKLDKHEQELARGVFSGLIEVGRGTQDTKRTALIDEFPLTQANANEVKVIVQKLADARLITTDEENGKETITLAHETLIQAWPWLKRLVDENREVIALQNQIAADAKEWEENKKNASYLYMGARLANAKEQLEARKLALGSLGQEYVKASISRKKRGQVFLFGGITTIIILLFAAVIIFANLRNEAEKQAQIALARQLAAQAQSIFAKGYSRQELAVLLAVRSVQLFPVSDATQILQSNTLASPTARMTHEGEVQAVAFSPDGRYVVSGSWDGTARVWEAATGNEVARTTHVGVVSSVAFSPDGKYVVSGSGDGTARVWEAATGNEIVRMTHESWVTSVAFSPDGKYVVSGSGDGTARVWEAATGNEIARMIHEGFVQAVAFSPNGNFVVSGGLDGTARVWEAATGNEVARMTHEGLVVSVAFSPDGKFVVSGSGDGTARVWEAATGNEIARMTHEGRLFSVAFSPDGKYVVSGSGDGTARVWEAATGNEVARMTHEGPVTSVAFSPDGKYVVSGGCNIEGFICIRGTALVWEATTGDEIARMTHEDAVTSVAFSPDGRYVVSGSDDGTILIWEAATGNEIARMPHDGFVYSVAFSPDGKYVVSGNWDGTVRVWEAATGNEVARMIHGETVTSVAFSPDGKYVVSREGVITARVWEAATGNEIARMPHDGYVYSVAISPDGEYVVSGGGDGTALVWEAATGNELAHMTHEGHVTSVTFSPDGKYVVSGSWDGTVRVWEAATGNELARMAHEDSVSSVAFSSDGNYVLSSGCDILGVDFSCTQGTARVWEAATGNELARMIHEGWVQAVVFSPDGKYVISGGGDGTARVWEAATGNEVARMTHEGEVQSVAFSPDGKYVVSGSWDGTVRVWEAATGNEIARMTHGGWVQAVAFSPDGKFVVSGGADFTARVWFWYPEDLIVDACSRVTRNLTRAEWKQYIGDALPYQAVCPNLPIEQEESP